MLLPMPMFLCMMLTSSFFFFSSLFFSSLIKFCLKLACKSPLTHSLSMHCSVFSVTFSSSLFSIVFFMHFTLFSALFSVLFSLLPASSFASLSAAVRTVEVITFSAVCTVFSCCFFRLCYRRRHVAPKAYSDNPSPHPDTGIGNIRPPL